MSRKRPPHRFNKESDEEPENEKGKEDDPDVEEGLSRLPLKASKEIRARIKKEKERDSMRRKALKERIAGGIGGVGTTATAKIASSSYNAAAAAFWGSWLFGSGVGRTMFVRPCHYEVKPIMWFCWPGEDDERK